MTRQHDSKHITTDIKSITLINIIIITTTDKNLQLLFIFSFI